MFPTVPTVASGDLLSSTTSPASTTHTFPNLSSLRGGAGPQAGDLLIAICVQYGAATAGNQFSSWGAAFAEVLDDSLASGTGVGAIGIATKTATGSESGTFTVTSVSSVKSVQFLMRIPAGTWQAVEIQAATRATGLAADPASFNPAGWDVADTLWIAVAGQTETSTTGSPPTLDSPPANFTGQAIVARVADAVGDITAGVAFRQQAAAAQDVAAWTASNANRGNGIATVIAIRPAPQTLYGAISKVFTFTKAVAATKKTFGQIAAPFTFIKAVAGYKHLKTAVAEVSLPSSGEPLERTNHSIKIRARTTSGSTGVLKAALYEGATNRSGDLTSSPLTNALADYTLSIPDASAANITDYSNLSIKFWGYDSAGNALVFEVADIYLELPISSGPSTLYGAVAKVFTFTKAVAATKQTFATTVTALTFTKNVSGRRQTFSQIVAPFTFVKAVSGVRTALGQIASPFTFVKSVAGSKETFAQITQSFTFVKNVLGYKTTFGQVAMTIVTTITTAGDRAANQIYGEVSASFIFLKDVVGRRTTFSRVELPLTFTKSVSGILSTFSQIAAFFTFNRVVSGRRTTFGQTLTQFTFTKSVSGVRTALSQIAAFFAFNKVVSGQRTTFSRVELPLTFTKSVSGIRAALGQIAALFAFNRVVSGRRTTFSRVDLPLIFTDQTSGRKETFGSLEFPINITFDVVAEMQGIRFGRTSMSLVFEKDVSGTKETFGQVSSPYLFSRSIQAVRTTFGRLDFPIEFVKATIGRRETFSSLAFPINTSFVVAGRRLAYGQVELSLVFGKQVIGNRKTFGKIVAPYSFDSELKGILEAFSSVDFSTDFIVDVKTGRVEAFSSLGLELLLSLETAGIIRPNFIILNLAKAIYLGSTSVDAVYTNSQKIWPK